MSAELFARNVPGVLDVLRNRCIGVAGCGGLGSNAAVALARAGIGRLILADFDRVEPSNLNRQHFFQRDIGQYKADALAEHIRAIHPGIELVVHHDRIHPDNVSTLFHTADLLLEAFDLAENKIWLIRTWTRLFPDRPIVCGNGLAGYGQSHTLHVMAVGNVYFCGDMVSEMSMGLISARVGIVANLQANTAIELLMDGTFHDSGESEG